MSGTARTPDAGRFCYQCVMRVWAIVVLASIPACTTPVVTDVGPPPTDTATMDAGTDAADGGSTIDARPDGGTDAGASDAGTDAGADTGGPDAGSDAGSDAGVCGVNRFGTADGSTADVRGDDFGRQTFDVVFCRAPALGSSVRVRVRARITAPGTEFPWDIFGTAVYVNGVGDYRDTLMTWTYVTVSGATFTDYELVLPADIDGNGMVDWRAGSNLFDVTTWSGYNDRPSNTGVDMLEVLEP